MPEPSLDAIRRSADFIDAVAAGHPVAPRDHADAALAALLAGWRDETRWPPATGLISEPQAVAALNAGLAEKRTGRTDLALGPATTKRSRRGMGVVGAAAAAVLCIGGFGAVVAGAGQGDALYGLRTMLFGTPKQVREDQVGLAARTELNQVQELISQGDWEQAQSKLVEVSSQVESIGDSSQKQELVEQFNDLSAKVVERDPAATAPPGITYTVPPSSTELVPTVAPTSVPSTPPPTEATTSGESATSEASETPALEPGSSSEAPPSEPPTASETTATPAPSSAAAATSVPSSASASASASATAQTATPTSAAPTATPTSTATNAPKSDAGVQISATTAPPAPATSAAPTTAAQTAVSPEGQEGPQTLPPSVTTTVPAPVPVG